MVGEHTSGIARAVAEGQCSGQAEILGGLGGRGRSPHGFEELLQRHHNDDGIPHGDARARDVEPGTRPTEHASELVQQRGTRRRQSVSPVAGMWAGMRADEDRGQGV